MRKNDRKLGALVLAAGTLVVLGACGGSSGGNNASAGDTLGNPASSTPAATPATPATPSATAAATPSAAPAGAAPAGAAGKAIAPTGKTWDVKMIGDEKGYRYEPANLTIKVGDAVRFTNVSGGPHNIAFNTVPSGANAQVDANMPAATSSGGGPKLGEMSSPLLVAPNDTYTVSFAGVPAGTYAFNCTPHAALGMKGQFTVQ